MSNPLAMPQVIEANGLKFGYHSLGKGPLVLFMHGFPDTAKAWDQAVVAVAAAGYRAVAPYMRGYAPTESPATDTTGEDLAADVIGLLDAFEAETAVLVGHDWGAAAVYGAAALAPQRVSKLIAVALPHPAGFKPHIADLWPARHFVTFRRKSAPGRFVSNDFKGLRDIYRRWSPQWELADAELADIKRCLSNPESLQAIFGYYRALERKPSDLMRRKLSVPTTAIAGRSDGAVPLRAFREAGSRFTSEYAVLELPGGHFPHRENPKEFVDLLLGVLGD